MAPVLIAAVALLAYAGSFRGAFIFDDIRVLERAAGDDRFPAASFLPDSARPVADLTFLANYAVSGARAADYHLVNLLIHIGAALFLFGVVKRTAVRRGRSRRAAGAFGAAVAILWAVHPLTTAAVTYVAQRYEVLMAFFYLAMLYAFVRGVDASPGRQRWWFLGCVLACYAGMGSKEVMITAPLAVVLYDWVFVGQGSGRRMLRDRWLLYAGLAAGWLVLAALMVRKAHGPEAESYVGTLAGPFHYLLTQFGVMGRYLVVAVRPWGLCFDYGWPPVERVAPAVVPALVTMAGVAVTVAGLWRRRVWGFACAWWLLVLAPTSTVVPRPDVIMEHRAYLALPGVLALIVAAFDAARRRWAGCVRPRWTAGLAALLVVALMGLTHVRNRAFRTEVAVWRDVLSKRPRNIRAMVSLGAALLHEGETAEGEATLMSAAAALEQPDLPPGLPYNTLKAITFNNLGVVASGQGRRQDAAIWFRRALVAAPDWAKARENLERVQ